MKRNVLITGGAGYLGSVLAERLIRLGYNVTLYDSLIHDQTSLPRIDAMLTSDISVIDSLLRIQVKTGKKPKDFMFVEGDIRDNGRLRTLFKEGNFDFVFHFAELVGEPACKQYQDLARDINYWGSRYVIDLASRHGATLIYNSSSSVYGFSANPDFSDEDSPLLHKDSPYCTFKKLCEMHIKNVAERNADFRFIIIRPATVGGLSPRMRLDLLPNLFTYGIFTKGKVGLTDADHYRAVIAIDDLIDAYVAILNATMWHNGIFNVGSHNKTKNEYAEEIGRIASNGSFEVRSSSGLGDVRNLKLSDRKFREAFGANPSRSIEDIVLPLVLLLRRDVEVFSRDNYRGVINCSKEEFERLLNG